LDSRVRNETFQWVLGLKRGNFFFSQAFFPGVERRRTGSRGVLPCGSAGLCCRGASLIIFLILLQELCRPNAPFRRLIQKSARQSNRCDDQRARAHVQTVRGLAIDECLRPNWTPASPRGPQSTPKLKRAHIPPPFADPLCELAARFGEDQGPSPEGLE